MDLKRFRENSGTILVIRPRPKADGAYIKESMNQWIFIDEVKDGTFLLKNTITNHQFEVTTDNIREFRNPAFLILAMQVTLGEKGAVTFEPFAPGLKDTDSLSDLVDPATRPWTNSVYQDLKPYEGKFVTLRFPEKEGWKFGDVEAVLDTSVTRPPPACAR
jgi:hypothetical protein